MRKTMDLIADYKAGKLSLDELAQTLGNRTYKTPKRFTDAERDKPALWRQVNYDPVFGGEGTWDEIDIAWARGLLTDDEHDAISDAAEKAFPE